MRSQPLRDGPPLKDGREGPAGFFGQRSQRRLPAKASEGLHGMNASHLPKNCHSGSNSLRMRRDELPAGVPGASGRRKGDKGDKGRGTERLKLFVAILTPGLAQPPSSIINTANANGVIYFSISIARRRLITFSLYSYLVL